MTDQPHDAIEEIVERYHERELLRFLTCGSVDDGKSTLIGRLLHDADAILDDQLRAVRRDTARHGSTGEPIDFALLVDGLEAEREQGITIDVAYRYFSTARRKFIIADTPGHEQYTRNMATGASTCHLAVILVDARKGVLPQTRRHAFIATLLGIRHLVVAVNKMDLVDYSLARFDAIRTDFSDFAAKLQVADLEFIPMSALRGENVVHPASGVMPWYRARPLLDHLENVHIKSDINLIDLRLPVQLVLRGEGGIRGYAGTIASGILRKGDELAAFPAGRRARVKALLGPDGDLDEAFAPMSISVSLDDEIDVSRGTMLAHPNNAPDVVQDFDAMVVWMHDKRMEPGTEYLIKHTSVTAPARVVAVRYRMNIISLHREAADSLALNEIGRLRLETSRPLMTDPYDKNRTTGAFIIIDPIDNSTLGAGMILDREEAEDVIGSEARLASAVLPEQRYQRLGQEPLLIAIEGDPADAEQAASALERILFERGWFAVALVRGRRGGSSAELLLSLGAIVVVPASSVPVNQPYPMVTVTVGPEEWSIDGARAPESTPTGLARALEQLGLPRKA
ncbi:MAG TPA: sulfate adenylyltransferase subunit CysN [Thermoanaerobaculia bacterium]|nr:sulfate adenylyltransferase subunit CysN [Thermoanaerobaculia bacterium]